MKVKTIDGRNINHVYPQAVKLFLRRNPEVIPVSSRGGKRTLEHYGIVTTTYQRPCERVLFNPIRDCNPFFHFFETLWILAGRNDVKWASYFLPRIADYSDDGISFHGAYGYRMRRRFHHDQLEWVVNHLREDPTSRRAVVTIHNAGDDHTDDSKDIPCNIALDFLHRNDALHLTVFNRSNDMLWGAYGANVVQFSTILEFVAGMLGCKVGTYTQVSNSFHVYRDEPAWIRVHKSAFNGHADVYADPYSLSRGGRVEPYPLLTGGNDYVLWGEELAAFMAMTNHFMETSTFNALPKMRFSYFKDVAEPMFFSFVSYKQKNFSSALAYAAQCKAQDWSVYTQTWLKRREHAKAG
jgi:Thymidylate synthase